MSEWTSIAQPMRYLVELDAPLTVRRERGLLVEGDVNANAFVLEINQTKGKPADLTDCTVYLHFIRPDKLAAPPIEATLEGNIATAELTKTCYRVSGMYGAFVTIKKNGKERTILKTVGDILSTSNDGMVDEEGVFPTTEELLQMMAELEQAIKDAEAAATNANAAAGNANTSASKADAAAANANKWANAEANAASLSAESQPTVDVTEKDGSKVLSFGIPAGKTPNITFRVATGEPGTQVQIAQSGTAENPIIDLTIPRGDTGAVEGIDYYAGSPAALGTASPGKANGVARGDHVHPMPSAADVGARPSTWMPTAADVGARPSTWMPTAADVGARPNTWTPSAADVGALAANGTAADSAMLGGKPPEYYTSSASEVVWENASPTSEFAAQTVSLDLSDAKHIEIVTDERSNYDTYFCITRIPVDGNKYTIQSLGNMGTAFRFVTATATGVVFGEGNTATPTPSDSGWAYGTLNYLVVPMKITKIV